jgi:DNA-binding response OmpR family regulator
MAMSQEQSVVSDLDTAKTILIVEDDAHIGEFLERVLSEETPYKPLVVSDGFEALKVTHEVKPNLFVLDYQLPGMDGIELYDQLHAVKAFQHTPAIIISACLPKRELEKRSLVGLRKPLELSELLEAIQEVLEREAGQSQ